MPCACVVLHCHLWPVWLYHIFSPTLSHKRHDFREKVIAHEMSVLIFSTTFAGNIILSEASLIYKRLHVKCPLFSSDVNEIWNFSTNFLKGANIKFHENSSSRADERTDKRIDMTKLTVAFRNFANAPRIYYKLFCTRSSYLAWWIHWNIKNITLKHKEHNSET